MAQIALDLKYENQQRTKGMFIKSRDNLAFEREEAKAAALKHYEAAAPFLAAALPSLHPVAVHNPRLSEPPAIAMLRCLSAVAVSELWRSGRRACTHSLLLARWTL